MDSKCQCARELCIFKASLIFVFIVVDVVVFFCNRIAKCTAGRAMPPPPPSCARRVQRAIVHIGRHFLSFGARAALSRQSVEATLMPMNKIEVNIKIRWNGTHTHTERRTFSERQRKHFTCEIGRPCNQFESTKKLQLTAIYGIWWVCSIYALNAQRKTKWNEIVLCVCAVNTFHVARFHVGCCSRATAAACVCATE